MEPSERNLKAAALRKLKQQSKSDYLLGADRNSKSSSESASSRLSHTQLAKFCPKKFFYVVFVTEDDNDSAMLLDKFVNVSRNYEIVSSVTFITREDVLTLLDDKENNIFPNQLKPLLLDVIESAKEFEIEDIPCIYQAQLLKLQLIHVMYQQYAAQVKQNRKEKNLENLLNVLSKECRSKKQKKDEQGKPTGTSDKKSPTREEEKKKNKKDDKGKEENKDEDIDYTSIPLDKNGVTFEENLFDYVWFYCIKGFYNNEILHCFTEQLNCPLCAVIKVTNYEAHSLHIPDHIKSFWENINSQFFGNTSSFKFLEDTMLMHFTPSQNPTEDNILELFQQFVFVLRRIVDVKLSHLRYLRHLTLNKIENVYAVIPLDCMQTYYRSLRSFPLECVNSTLILDALLKEVCYNLDIKSTLNTASSGSLLLPKSLVSHSIHCIDPMRDFDAFASVKKKASVSNTKHNVGSFLTQDHNELVKISKFYKHIGPKISDISINFMKRNPVFENILSKAEYPVCNISHTHDIDPSSKFEVKDKELLDNFMYLFLFNIFRDSPGVPNAPESYNLTKNLMTFNICRFWDEVQPKCDVENGKTKSNLYNTSLVHFRWKEKLNGEVMIQEIFNATNNFLYCDQKYSPETDNYLIVFSNKLDAFGLNTKIFESLVRTPLCLRDFCRYATVEEADWLQEHQIKIIEPHSFKVNLNEVCSGAYKVKTQMKIFQEYSYLLDGNIKEDVEDVGTYEDLKEAEECPNGASNFEEVFADLQAYPTRTYLTQECGNALEHDQLLGFDLCSNAFRITGHTTTFCSHDGVKVIVDNTRFLQSPEKCTVSIICDGNTLILHSSEALKSEPYVLTLLLKDDTRISFITKRPVREITKKHVVEEELREETEETINNFIYETQEEPKNEENEPVESDDNQIVHCVDEDFLKHLFDDGQDIESLPINEDREDLLEAILNARENNAVIYKVNTESNYLKRLNCDLNVPIQHALRDVIPREILANSNPKQYETHTKRFDSPNEDKSSSEILSSVDFRVCLPNGLFIRAHPGVIHKKDTMIKQEYAGSKPDLETVQHEEFRLFSYQGFICIKKIDGTITILKGNGDIIDFEKPSDGSGESNSYKPCRCSTLDDYRNKLNKLLKDENNSKYFTSRRGHIAHKQNHVLDKKLLTLLADFDVPYIKKSITRFDGKNIKIQGTKITQKQLYHMTSQQDFLTEEIFFERSDDFRSTIERNGSQKIYFPDGTIISNSVDIADELVDDFVYVTISFQYEHPHYATVTYDLDRTLKIMLNNDVVVKKLIDAECFTVNLKKNISVAVSKEKVSLQKSCQDCLGNFQCDFNIEPFYANEWTPSAEFLHVQDTYEKNLYSDFVGNCYRKSEYIKERLNSLNCNHYKKFNNYKKFFVVNRDFTGEMFSTNDMVQTKLTSIASDPDGSVSSYKIHADKSGEVFDCRKKIYIRYCDRFFNNSAYKYFQPNTGQQELYSTFRIFHTMFQSIKEIEDRVLKLKQVYFTEFFDSPGHENVIKNVGSLIDDLETYYKTYEKEMLAENEIRERKQKDQEEEEFRKRTAYCLCIKRRITIANKIDNWRLTCQEARKKLRNEKIPNYFASDFCNRLE